jgi:hypothetical protein
MSNNNNKKDTSTTAYSTKATRDWTKQDVANWIRKVLKYSDQEEDERIALDISLNIVTQDAYNGAALLLFKDEKDLKSTLRLLGGHARILWDEIENMKKSLAEPDSKKRKITQLDGGDQSEGDHKAKKQKLKRKNLSKHATYSK